MLFSDRSILTMVHGIGFGGAALLGLAAAMFYLHAARASTEAETLPRGANSWARLTVLTSVILWLTVITGTYVVFPQYRATPPAGADLAAFPRALLTADPSTAWLHAFAMEIKEHMPWIAAMLTSAAAFVALRYRARVLHDAALRPMVFWYLAASFALVALASVLGVFVNKVAPLQ